MAERQAVLEEVARLILARASSGVTRVGIDGVDGAGKSHFAGELAPLLEAAGRPVIRATVDRFHNPRAVRYRQGKGSPVGFYEDSYDYEALCVQLLDPLSPGGSGVYRSAWFDHERDSRVEVAPAVAPPGAILLLDGIFLHRPRLRGYWDFSIWLEVGFSISIPRGAQRGSGHPDPADPSNRRYVEGQKLYLRQVTPRQHATLVINNEQLAAPFIVRAAPDDDPSTEATNS